MKTIEKYERKIHERVWGQEIFVAETEHYLGKMLVMKAGTMGGLQQHVDKDETFFLFDGVAWVDSDDGEGNLIRTKMFSGESYRIPPGASHRVEAITNCTFFECSTPHYDDRIRMEEHYGLETPGGDMELETTRYAEER